jgi:uncharacterized protein YcgL (UPF0745 family)
LAERTSVKKSSPIRIKTVVNKKISRPCSVYQSRDRQGAGWVRDRAPFIRAATVRERGGCEIVLHLSEPRPSGSGVGARSCSIYQSRDRQGAGGARSCSVYQSRDRQGAGDARSCSIYQSRDRQGAGGARS